MKARLSFLTDWLTAFLLNCIARTSCYFFFFFSSSFFFLHLLFLFSSFILMRIGRKSSVQFNSYPVGGTDSILCKGPRPSSIKRGLFWLCHIKFIRFLLRSSKKHGVNPTLSIRPGPLRPGVGLLVRTSSTDQIDRYENYWYLIGIIETIQLCTNKLLLSLFYSFECFSYQQ